MLAMLTLMLMLMLCVCVLMIDCTCLVLARFISALQGIQIFLMAKLSPNSVAYHALFGNELFDRNLIRLILLYFLPVSHHL